MTLFKLHCRTNWSKRCIDMSLFSTKRCWLFAESLHYPLPTYCNKWFKNKFLTILVKQFVSIYFCENGKIKIRKKVNFMVCLSFLRNRQSEINVLRKVLGAVIHEVLASQEKSLFHLDPELKRKKYATQRMIKH